MLNFTLYNPTEIIFGKDSIEKIGQMINGKYKNILVHYGSDRIKTIGLFDRVMDKIDRENTNIYELGGVEPNPKLGKVYEGIKIAKEKEVDFILCLGGGSVIDSAKAIALGALSEYDVWEYFEGKHEVERALPLGVVLTIPATGSESSMGTVITKEDGLLKKSVNHDLLRPVFAILNPELTFSLPEIQTFAGVTDIMSHILERYITNTEAVELTDELCEATMRTVINNAYKLLEDPNNYDARSEIMLAGNIAHNGVLGMGREDDWASHRIGHELSGLYGMTHGVSLSIIMPHWMEYVYKENIERFMRFGVKVFGLDENLDPEVLAMESIRSYKEFLEKIHMPTNLTSQGIDNSNFELMAEKCTEYGSVGSFKVLDKEDVIKIYEMSL